MKKRVFTMESKWIPVEQSGTIQTPELESELLYTRTSAYL